MRGVSGSFSKNTELSKSWQWSSDGQKFGGPEPLARVRRLNDHRLAFYRGERGAEALYPQTDGIRGPQVKKENMVFSVIDNFPRRVLQLEKFYLVETALKDRELYPFSMTAH